MDFLRNSTLAVQISEYVWGGSSSSEISSELCRSNLPFSIPMECVSVLLTKLIGIAIIVGASLNKAPIFYNIYKTKSGSGFSIASVYGEAIMYSNAAFYGILRGNPFTSWGENGVVTLQAIGVVVMLWIYKKDPVINSSQRLMAMTAYVFYAFCIFTFLQPSQYYLLQAANWFVLSFARGSQILSTFHVGHTGNQSIITILMNFGGSAVRIATTLKEIGWDMPLLSGYLLSSLLNIIMMIQFFYYRKSTAKFLEALQPQTVNKKDRKVSTATTKRTKKDD